MLKNLGTVDRAVRLVGASVAGLLAAVGPLSGGVRLGLFAVLGAYLLFTALSGTCLGYRLMGMSTCSSGRRV